MIGYSRTLDTEIGCMICGKPVRRNGNPIAVHTTLAHKFSRGEKAHVCAGCRVTPEFDAYVGQFGNWKIERP